MKPIPDDWLRHVRAWQQSGETAPEYSARVGVKLGSLRYWGSRVKKDLDAAVSRPSVRMARVVRAADAPKASPERPEPGRIVIAAGAFRVEVGPGFDDATLCRVLGVLGDRDGAARPGR